MPRPKNNRIVNEPPLQIGFKPIGVVKSKLDKINLTLDEFEAIRLADYKNYSHAEAAEAMGISRPTFSRLIKTARKNIADFIIHGKFLYIEGGNIHFRNNIIQCIDCKNTFKTNIGMPLVVCPDCNSNNLFNLAEDFGHGRCCVNIN